MADTEGQIGQIPMKRSHTEHNALLPPRRRATGTANAGANTCRSITVLFSACSDASELIAEGTTLARQRQVTLELVAFVPTLQTLLFWIGRSMAPAVNLTPAQFEQDLVHDVARVAATVPEDIGVRWRLLGCGRRRATRRVFGASGLWQAPSVASYPVGVVSPLRSGIVDDRPRVVVRRRVGSLFATGDDGPEDKLVSLQAAGAGSGTSSL